jgi:streptogramin lyase
MEANMRYVLSVVTLPVVLFAAVAGITGCSTFSAGGFPNASANPSQAPLGTIQGSDFGGHAPLVGAHVYVLQPSTSGYGNQATSLLTATYTGTTYPTYANTSDPGIPVGWYYETTDATGAFNISGDYTCTAGQPVYLYLYGGSPTYPSASNTFTSNQFVVQADILGLTGVTTYTFTTTTTENFYVGEQITLSGYTGNFSILNGPQVVTAVSLSTNTVSVTAPTFLLEVLGTQNLTGTITAEPSFNPAVVNLAVLGNCPNGATDAGFGNSIRYVYVNEVSTAAAAYAFAPFTLSTNNDATHIGTSPTNLLGIENAALTAGQLYDIQGSSISTTYAGEGHIARQYTPAGNGIVPQNLLDTVGNILAQCVDSNNGATVVGGTGTINTGTGVYPAISPQCNTLFQYATNTGVPTSGGTGSPGNQPFDTATAALNIARHPAGDPSNTAAFVSNLYGLPAGNPPFAPRLTAQPTDFGVAILYPASKTIGNYNGSGSTTVTNTGIASPEAIAVDGSGNVWIENYATPSVKEFSPLGVQMVSTAYGTNTPGYLAIDPTNDIWVGTNTTDYLTELNPSGGFLSTGGTSTTGFSPYTGVTGYNTKYSGAQAVTLDGAGNVYVGDQNNAAGYRVTQSSSAGVPSSTSFVAAVSACFGTSSTAKLLNINHAAVDSQANGYNLWLTSEGTNTVGNGVICKINTSTGGLVTGFTTALEGVDQATTSNEFISIDASGNAWIPSGYKSTPELLKVTPAGAVTAYHTGANFNFPFGSVIDGNNTVWVADRGNGTLANFNTANLSFISPSTNYLAGGVTSQLLNIAADPSGNVWATDYFGNNFVEFVGMAGPTYTPIALAAKNNKLGVAP